MKIIHILRKPLSESSITQNVLTHGCGALNIEISRIPSQPDLPGSSNIKTSDSNIYSKGLNASAHIRAAAYRLNPPPGRWPSNLVLQGPTPTQDLNQQAGIRTSGTLSPSHQRHVPRLGTQTYGKDPGTQPPKLWPGDSGFISRFFLQILSKT